MGRYLDAIINRFRAQEAKGVLKYGQPLEQNHGDMQYRLEHLAQELTDGLYYLEWIKEQLGEDKAMQMNTYQQLAARTINPEQEPREAIINFAFGLTGETGETIDLLKKILFHGHDMEINKDKLVKELGDILWYVAGIATTAELSLQDIAATNIDKLRQRYPDGFSQQKSQQRAEYETH